jgi:RHS repeat-associated protein
MSLLKTADAEVAYCSTGKERDAESGNDYFGARYYASSMGRWMSPDDSLNGAIMELPQTWNKYSYEYNRPLYGTDPNGRCPPCIGAIIGGVVQGGFDLGKQLYNNGGNLDLGKKGWEEVGANFVGGALTGALAGATGGASLVESAVVGDLAAGATSSIVGGIATRGLDPNTPSNDVLSAGAVSGDALAGFVGGAGRHIAGDFVHVPGEPTFSMSGRNGRVYNQAYRNGLRALATRDQALNNQAVRSSLGSGGSNVFSLWWNWFTNQPPAPPLNPHSTATIVGCTTLDGKPCQ